MGYSEHWNKVFQINDELRRLMNTYWENYSSFGDWQFWLVLAVMLVPLVLVYFVVDRKRIFEIFFFGYTVHIVWTYIDIGLAKYNLFIHTYFLTPLFPAALSMTASALPVGYLLVYQYCTNHKKNFYLYALLLSAVFAFGFATIEEYLGLVEMRKGMNQFHIFLLDLAVVYPTYWFTKLIKKMKK